MEVLAPWSEFCAPIGPYYPKAGNGKPPVGPERMLRMYFPTNGFNPVFQRKPLTSQSVILYT
jgi:IS5 family transposase